MATVKNDLIEVAEDRLARTYGHARNNKDTGIRWLLGSSINVPSYLDHYEYRIKDGKRTIDARPYSLSSDDLKELIALAERKNLRLHIQAPSNYNTSTVVVILTEVSP